MGFCCGRPTALTAFVSSEIPVIVAAFARFIIFILPIFSPAMNNTPIKSGETIGRMKIINLYQPQLMNEIIPVLVSCDVKWDISTWDASSIV